MLCSLGELGLTKHDFPYAIEDGIFLIEEDCTVGQDIHEAIGLNDTSVEFEITSNRPDCLSVVGLAREAAVTFGKPLNLKAPEFHGSADKLSDSLSVSVGKCCTLPAVHCRHGEECQDRSLSPLDAGTASCQRRASDQ